MEHLANGMEHRWGERIRVNIPVYVSAGAFPGFDGCVKNLSLSGALMKSDCELRLHALIDVHIKLPPPSPRVHIVKGACLAQAQRVRRYRVVRVCAGHRQRLAAICVASVLYLTREYLRRQ